MAVSHGWFGVSGIMQDLGGARCSDYEYPYDYHLVWSRGLLRKSTVKVASRRIDKKIGVSLICSLSRCCSSFSSDSRLCLC